jgi:DivIVA domain-containing protein
VLDMGMDVQSAPARAAEIAVRRFALARRGYDPEEVRRYLTYVAGEIERLQLELRRQQARGDLLERRSAAAAETAYAHVTGHMVEVVRAADEAAARLLSGARTEAQAQLTRARDEAARIVESARAEAREIASFAGTEAERRRARTDRPDRAREVWAREERLAPPAPEPEPSPDATALAGLWEERPWPTDFDPGGSASPANGHRDPDA